MERRSFFRAALVGIGAQLLGSRAGFGRLHIIGDGNGDEYAVTVMVNGRPVSISITGPTSTVGAVMSSYAARNDCGFGTNTAYGRYVYRIAGTAVTADSNPTWIYAVRDASQTFDDTVAGFYIDNDPVSAGQIVEWQLTTV